MNIIFYSGAHFYSACKLFCFGCALLNIINILILLIASTLIFYDLFTFGAHWFLIFPNFIFKLNAMLLALHPILLFFNILKFTLILCHYFNIFVVMLCHFLLEAKWSLADGLLSPSLQTIWIIFNTRNWLQYQVLIIANMSSIGSTEIIVISII